MEIEFVAFPKITRYSREVIVTEKLDGTNALIWVSDDGTELKAGSRSRWITPQQDNYGFATWVEANKEELLKLGPGYHYGEWFGKGIQRNYGLDHRKFALFNTTRWTAERPACCDVVPILWRGKFDELDANGLIEMLKAEGSTMVPGFMKPEGIMIYHVPSNMIYKKTVEGDDSYKGAVEI